MTLMLCQLRRCCRFVAPFVVLVSAALSLTDAAAQQRGQQGPPAPRRLVIVDRNGSQTDVGQVPGNTNGPRVSPDGRRLAYGSGGLWVGPLDNLQAHEAHRRR